MVGPLGFVGFAWPDFAETVAAHAVRIIDEARRRDTRVVAVSQDAFNRWNTRIRRHGKAVHLYLTDCSPGCAPTSSTRSRKPSTTVPKRSLEQGVSAAARR